MMKSWAIKRLYFPEPAAVGGGGGAGTGNAEGSTGAPAPGDEAPGGGAVESPPSETAGKGGTQEQDDANPWDFDVDAVDDPDAEEGEGGQADTEDGGEVVNIQLPEALNVPQEYQGMLSEVAQSVAAETGMPTAQAQRFAQMFAEKALTRDREMMKSLYEEQDRQLREEWGVNYSARCKAAIAHAAKIARMCGLTNEEMAVYKSPVGLRSLYKQSLLFSEGRMGKAGASAPARSPREEMHDILHNPDNPYHRGVVDPNAKITERRAAAQRLNSLAGCVLVPVP